MSSEHADLSVTDGTLARHKALAEVLQDKLPLFLIILTADTLVELQGSFAPSNSPNQESVCMHLEPLLWKAEQEILLPSSVLFFLLLRIFFFTLQHRVASSSFIS